MEHSNTDIVCKTQQGLLYNKDVEIWSEFLCVEKNLFCQVSVFDGIWNNYMGWSKWNYKGLKSAKKGSSFDDKQI